MSRIHPGLPGSVVTASNDLYVKNDKMTRGVDITVTPEVYDQYKQGYRCLSCHAAQESSWPDECIEPYCRFKMKTEQPKLMEMGEMQGEKDLWPTHNNESDIWTPN